MTLLSRMADYDSIQEMDAARMDRYWDGLACALEGRYFGACYLLGYTIEMSLKIAYFRVLDLDESHDVRDELTNARNLARARNVRTNLHDLNFWAETLAATRAQRGNPLDPKLVSALQIYATQAALNWSQVMRYRRSIATMDDFHQLLGIVDWITDHHAVLWS